MAAKLRLGHKPYLLVCPDFHLPIGNCADMICRPGLLNSIAGLLTTVVNVYTVSVVVLVEA